MIHFCFSLIQNLAVFFNSFLPKFDRNERKKRKIKTNEIKRSKLFAKLNDGEIDNWWLPFFPFLFPSVLVQVPGY